MGIEIQSREEHKADFKHNKRSLNGKTKTSDILRWNKKQGWDDFVSLKQQKHGAPKYHCYELVETESTGNFSGFKDEKFEAKLMPKFTKSLTNEKRDTSCEKTHWPLEQ